MSYDEIVGNTEGDFMGILCEVDTCRHANCGCWDLLREAVRGSRVPLTATEVKNLQAVTGCGIIDCKDALTLCGGDATLAKEFLRYKGCAVVTKDKDGNHVPDKVWALRQAKKNLGYEEHHENTNNITGRSDTSSSNVGLRSSIQCVRTSHN